MALAGSLAAATGGLSGGQGWGQRFWRREGNGWNSIEAGQSAKGDDVVRRLNRLKLDSGVSQGAVL